MLETLPYCCTVAKSVRWMMRRLVWMWDTPDDLTVLARVFVTHFVKQSELFERIQLGAIY